MPGGDDGVPSPIHLQPPFQEGAALINAYFLKVDASGHSRVVRENPHDKSDLLFDLVERALIEVIESERKAHQCAYARVWSWQGDGGLCVVYDEKESIANATAVSTATGLLDKMLPSLRLTLRELQIEGGLDLRIAVHKGAFRYKTQPGSIHSRELNFVSHLEKVTPRNTVAISKAVFQAAAPKTKSLFTELDFSFEEEKIYFYSAELPSTVAFAWIGRVPISSSVLVNMFTQRPTQFDKAMMLRQATRDVVTLGTALRTCSRYLTTKEKPGLYKREVLNLLRRGVNYTALVLDPTTEIAKLYQAIRGQHLVENIEESISLHRDFAKVLPDTPGRFSLFAYNALPHLACICIDREASGLLLVSPYMPSSEEAPVDRSDTIHYALTRDQDAGLYAQINQWVSYYLTKGTSRLV